MSNNPVPPLQLPFTGYTDFSQEGDAAADVDMQRSRQSSGQSMTVPSFFSLKSPTCTIAGAVGNGQLFIYKPHPPTVRDAIERTPEYQAFIQELALFHRARGTVFAPEPVLGHTAIDLLQLMRAVEEAGGQDKVTEERLWRRMADPFKLPATCTNAAFVMRRIYTSSLAEYVEAKQNGTLQQILESGLTSPGAPPPSYRGPGSMSKKPPPPAPVTPAPIAPITTENQLDLAQNTALLEEQYKRQLRDRELLKTVVPIQRRVTLPTTTPSQRQTIQQQKQQQQKRQIIRPILSRDEIDIDARWEFLRGGAQSRMMMAFASQLPNEIDWAMNQLVVLSYFDEPSTKQPLLLARLPHLLDFLLSQTSFLLQDVIMAASRSTPQQQYQCLIELWYDNKDKIISEEKQPEDVDVARHVDRLQQILLVLLNLLHSRHNTRLLCATPTFIQHILVPLLQLRFASEGDCTRQLILMQGRDGTEAVLREGAFVARFFTRLFYIGLEILESTATHYHLYATTWFDSYLVSLILEAKDRSVICSALRILAVHGTDPALHGIRLAKLPVRLLNQCESFLQSSDPILVTAALDFWRHYLSCASQSRLSVPIRVDRLVRHLFPIIKQRHLALVPLAKSPKKTVPLERRIMHWLWLTFTEDQNALMPLGEIQASVMILLKKSQLPLISLAQLLEMIHQLWPDATAVTERREARKENHRARSISPEQRAIAEEQEHMLVCRWQNCDAVCDDRDGLYEHVLAIHLNQGKQRGRSGRAAKETAESKNETNKTFSCQWQDCSRVWTSVEALKRHLRVHLPPPSELINENEDEAAHRFTSESRTTLPHALHLRLQSPDKLYQAWFKAMWDGDEKQASHLSSHVHDGESSSHAYNALLVLSHLTQVLVSPMNSTEDPVENVIAVSRSRKRQRMVPLVDPATSPTTSQQPKPLGPVLPQLLNAIVPAAPMEAIQKALDAAQTSSSKLGALFMRPWMETLAQCQESVPEKWQSLVVQIIADCVAADSLSSV